MAHPFDSILQRKLHTRGHPPLFELPDIVGQASISSVIPSLSVSVLLLAALMLLKILLLFEAFGAVAENDIFFVELDERNHHAV